MKLQRLRDLLDMLIRFMAENIKKLFIESFNSNKQLCEKHLYVVLSKVESVNSFTVQILFNFF